MKRYLLLSLFTLGAINVFGQTIDELSDEVIYQKYQTKPLPIIPRKYIADDSGITPLPVAKMQTINERDIKKAINDAQNALNEKSFVLTPQILQQMHNKLSASLNKISEFLQTIHLQNDIRIQKYKKQLENLETQLLKRLDPIITSLDQANVKTKIADVEQETELEKLQQKKLELENKLKRGNDPISNISDKIQAEQRRLQELNLSDSPMLRDLFDQHANLLNDEDKIEKQLQEVRKRIRELQ
jgi:hypothetical protein